MLQEFCAAAAPLYYSCTAALRRAFDFFDSDASGDIDVKEMRRALSDLGLRTEGRAEALAVLQRYDADRSGKIELPEFQRLVVDLRKYLDKGYVPPRKGFAPLPLVLSLVEGRENRELGSATINLADANAPSSMTRAFDRELNRHWVVTSRTYNGRAAKIR